jgi:long-chain acyl-CoA synthetase
VDVNPIDQEIRELVAGRTVASEFLSIVERIGDRRALRWMEADESWGEMTFTELADKVARAAAGLRALGVGPGDRVVMMLRNIPEFHWVDLAAVFLGATPISIYNSSSADQVAYLAGHAEAKVAIVEDDGFLERFEKVRDQIPSLQAIVRLHDGGGGSGDVLSWATLTDPEPLDLAEAATIAQPDDLATIIYTSGTTGNPKGVMLTHANLCWTGESLMRSFEWDREKGIGIRLVSYLPMAHIAERMVSHYGLVFFGYEVTTCPDPSLIASYAREVHPQLMFGVPRVWEKVYGGLQAALAADPEKKEKFEEAVAAALPIEPKLAWGTATDEERATYEFLDAVAFSTVRELLGLDQMELAVTGAAPMVPDMLRYFRAIGIPLSEVYGMSENSGPLTFAPYRVKPGTVGPAIPGCEIRIADDGEVLARGGHVFAGYLNDPEKTADALEPDGWLHTGDIGELDEDGYLTIVDRKKELIITAGGKNVSPANLEAALKTIPLVGQAAAIGDKRPFVSALVVLDPDEAKLWAADHGLEGLSLAELAENEQVVAEIEAALPEVMAGFNNAERVKKVTVLGEEWLPDSDVLTPTSKLKRRGVNERYATQIEALYS